MASLTSKSVNAKVKGEPGRFSDGGGLYLVVLLFQRINT